MIKLIILTPNLKAIHSCASYNTKKKSSKYGDILKTFLIVNVYLLY